MRGSTKIGSIATKVPKVPQDQATVKPARKHRQKTARHDPELIESITDGGWFPSPLFWAAEEHGFQNKDNGHSSNAVASIFGQGRGHFQNKTMVFRTDSIGLHTLKQAA